MGGFPVPVATRMPIRSFPGVLLAAALLFQASTAPAAPGARTITGQVRLEGAADDGRAGSGLAGIAVSNGEDVVLTDAQGRYRIEAAEGGLVFVVTAFVVVVLGGMGSLEGAVVGSLIIGLVDSLAGYYIAPDLKEVVYFAIFLGILIVRPAGLFGIRGSE